MPKRKKNKLNSQNIFLKKCLPKRFKFFSADKNNNLFLMITKYKFLPVVFFILFILSSHFLINRLYQPAEYLKFEIKNTVSLADTASLIEEQLWKIQPDYDEDFINALNEIKFAGYVPHTYTPLKLPKIKLQAWQKNAVLVPGDLQKKPQIAIIIDDLGIDKKRTAAILSLPAPLTTSFLTYASNLKNQAVIAKSKGHEIMLHVPMEPDSRGYDPGPDVLKTSMTNEEIITNLEYMFNKIEGYVGINNHMGSKFTTDTRAMGVVIDELYDRGLLFIDSMTTPDSIGLFLAEKKGVPSAARSVFLDNLPGEEYAMRQLLKLEDLAKLNGYAIGIGHPRDGTISALSKWLRTIYDQGLTVVPVSHIVKMRYFSSDLVAK